MTGSNERQVGIAGSDAVRIDDPDDPRVAPYRNIRERDLVGREGRFVAEGKVVLDVLFRAQRFTVESVLVLENRLEGLRRVLSSAPADLPVYVASRAVMDAIAGFHIHRGILAIGRRGDTQSADDLLAGLPPRALVVMLVGISNHDNVGAIFRNAAAFGADAVLLDATSCDPLYRKAIRVSVGAALKVPFAAGPDAESTLALLARHAFVPVALSPRGRDDIRTLARPERVALVLGTEGEGLPEALMARMRTARIAMAPGFDSLNVAAASAIALHELWEGQ
ncbi:RNA methyltransferase [Mesorhizobium sp. L-8-10]|uniref:TrmH family RNA methyltransferase n=1 Tax=Mesorhizobium sp. L-8-10 TaxID=2744523 RepID=UPI0019251D4E|nr:RNA methyltransferase [Mesorhizobium sp. L-8-10]BCH31310.1 RNA methyltransferase [Mesorhizobium sp. L-8-10]